MAANGFLQNGCMQNEYLFLVALQRLVYEGFSVAFQI